MNKKYKLAQDDMKNLVSGYGGCICTDRITVDGCKVGYMYRENPHNEKDSGWRFFAGDENDDYMSDTNKHDVYSVNTVANYSPDIIAFLDSPIGSAFERDESGLLKRVVD